jgi:hypothetical protein
MARVGTLSEELGKVVQELDEATGRIAQLEEDLANEEDANDLLFEAVMNLVSVAIGYGTINGEEVIRSCDVAAVHAKDRERPRSHQLLTHLRRFLSGNAVGVELLGLNWERALADGRARLR